MAGQTSFSVYAGEDFTIPVTLEIRQSVAGWEMLFEAVGSLSLRKIIKTTGAGGVETIDVAAGVFVVRLDAADTAGLDPQTYWWTFRRTDVAGNRVYASGSMYLLPVAG